MPMSRQLKTVMRAAKSPKEGTCAPGDGATGYGGSRMASGRKPIGNTAKAYKASGSSKGSSGKLII